MLLLQKSIRSHSVTSNTNATDAVVGKRKRNIQVNNTNSNKRNKNSTQLSNKNKIVKDGDAKKFKYNKKLIDEELNIYENLYLKYNL